MGIATLEDTSIPLTVTLGEDCVWKDQWDWTPVPQKVRLTIDGTAVVETIAPNSATQPITLHCSWLNKATVDDLIQLRDRADQTVMTLTLCDGTTKSVLFSHHKGIPIKVRPTLERPDYVNIPDPDWYDVTLNLFDAYGM